jgi:hypothetical protein
MDFFVLDTTNGMVKLVTLMMMSTSELGLAFLSPPIIELVPFNLVININIFDCP